MSSIQYDEEGNPIGSYSEDGYVPDSELGQGIAASFNRNLSKLNFQAPDRYVREGRSFRKVPGTDFGTVVEDMKAENDLSDAARQARIDAFGTADPSTKDAVFESAKNLKNRYARGIKENYLGLRSGLPYFEEGEISPDGQPYDWVDLGKKAVNYAFDSQFNKLSPEEQSKRLTDFADFKQRQSVEQYDEQLRDPGRESGLNSAVGGFTTFGLSAAPEILSTVLSKKFSPKGLMVGMRNAFTKNPLKKVVNVDNSRLAMPDDALKLFPSFLGYEGAKGAVLGAADENQTALDSAKYGMLSAIPGSMLAGWRMTAATPLQFRDTINSAQDYIGKSGSKLNIGESAYGTPAANRYLDRITGSNAKRFIDQRNVENQAELGAKLKSAIDPSWVDKKGEDYGRMTADFIENLDKKAEDAYNAAAGGGYRYDPGEASGLKDTLIDKYGKHNVGTGKIGNVFQTLLQHEDKMPPLVIAGQTPFSLAPVRPAAPIMTPAAPIGASDLQNIRRTLRDELNAAPYGSDKQKALDEVENFISGKERALNPNYEAKMSEGDNFYRAKSELDRKMDPASDLLEYGALETIDFPYAGPTGRKLSTDINDTALMLNPKGKIQQYGVTQGLGKQDQPEGDNAERWFRKLMKINTYGPNLMMSGDNPYLNKIAEDWVSLSLAPKKWITGSPAGVLAGTAGVGTGLNNLAAQGGVNIIMNNIEQEQLLREEAEKRKNPFMGNR